MIPLRRMAVLYTFREPSLCRQVHREFMRSGLLDLTPIILATACSQRIYVRDTVGLYGRDCAARDRIARRHGHERCTQVRFCPRLGLCHRRHAPVLCRLLTDLDRDAEVLVRIARFDARMTLRGLKTNAVHMPTSICLPWCHRCLLCSEVSLPEGE